LAHALSARLVLVGKVIRPHGYRGLLRIVLYAGEQASFKDVGSLFLKSVATGEIHEHTVISIRSHKDYFLMKLDGLNTRYDAEEHKGSEILVEKDALEREEDEFFWFELLDLDVYLDTGGYLGKISQIIPAKGNDIYIVKGEDREILIPATYEIIREIDLERKEMTIRDTEGLLDLNEV